DTLTLVRLGPSKSAYFGGDLPDLVLLYAGNGDFRRLWHHDRDAFGHRVHDVVAVPELELERFAVHGCAVADAGDFQRTRETVRGPMDEVLDQRARHAPHRARAFGIGARRHDDGAIVKLRLDIVDERERELAFRAFHRHFLSVNRRRHVFRDRYRLFANPGHCPKPSSSVLRWLGPPSLQNSFTQPVFQDGA